MIFRFGIFLGNLELGELGKIFPIMVGKKCLKTYLDNSHSDDLQILMNYFGDFQRRLCQLLLFWHNGCMLVNRTALRPDSGQHLRVRPDERWRATTQRADWCPFLRPVCQRFASFAGIRSAQSKLPHRLGRRGPVLWYARYGQRQPAQVLRRVPQVQSFNRRWEVCLNSSKFTYFILVPHTIVSDLSDNLPDIIISGNGYNLYNANPVIRQGSNVPVEASVRFWPRQWIKKTPGDGGEILTSLATREEIMLTLENIQHFLIR